MKKVKDFNILLASRHNGKIVFDNPIETLVALLLDSLSCL